MQTKTERPAFRGPETQGTLLSPFERPIRADDEASVRDDTLPIRQGDYAE
jgi:hypothetical protein